MNMEQTVVGFDLGDKYGQLCILSQLGEILEEAKIRMTPKALKERFEPMEAARIAIEAGTHSGWVNRILLKSGHEVLVANPRKLRMIYTNERKSDKLDAEMLARVARIDPQLLVPVRLRSEQAQQDLSVLHARDTLVRARTMLVNKIRGVAKSFGYNIKMCSASALPRYACASIPEVLKPALDPLIEVVRDLTGRIRAYDRQIELISENRYPETRLLRTVKGIGPVTALAFILVIGDPSRFKKSRDVPAYLGLVPARNQSGESDPQLHISKAGNMYLRRLLVSAAQYVLGPFGADSELRRWGLALAEGGGKRGKKRAVVGVARKLAVLLHQIWLTKREYEPFHGCVAKQAIATAEEPNAFDGRKDDTAALLPPSRPPKGGKRQPRRPSKLSEPKEGVST